MVLFEQLEPRIMLAGDLLSIAVSGTTAHITYGKTSWDVSVTLPEIEYFYTGEFKILGGETEIPMTQGRVIVFAGPANSPMITSLYPGQIPILPASPPPTPAPTPVPTPTPIPTPPPTLPGTDVYPPDPADGGPYTTYPTATLPGTDGNVTASDFVQYKFADCWLIAWGAGNPQAVANAVADDGAGYVVTFDENGSITRVHVSADLPTWFTPVDGSIICGIWEKAEAYIRTGANTYASLNNGNPADAAYTLDQPITQTFATTADAIAVQTEIVTAVARGESVEVLTLPTTSTLVASHVYTLTSITVDAAGTLWLNLRNPWGFDDATVTLATVIQDGPWVYSG